MSKINTKKVFLGGFIAGFVGTMTFDILNYFMGDKIIISKSIGYFFMVSIFIGTVIYFQQKSRKRKEEN